MYDRHICICRDKTPSLALQCCNEILEVIAASLEQAQSEAKATPPSAPEGQAVPADGSDAGTLTHPTPGQEGLGPVLHAGLRLPQDDSAMGGNAPAVRGGSSPVLMGGSTPSVDGGSAAAIQGGSASALVGGRARATLPQAVLPARGAEPESGRQAVGGAAAAFALKPRTVAPLTVKGGGLFGSAQGIAAKPLTAPKAGSSMMGGLFEAAQPSGQGSAPTSLAKDISSQPRSSQPTEAANESQPASAIGGRSANPTKLQDRPSTSGPSQPSAKSAIPTGLPWGRASKIPQGASVMGGMFGARTPQQPSVLGGMFASGRGAAAHVPTAVNGGSAERLQEVRKMQY